MPTNAFMSLMSITLRLAIRCRWKVVTKSCTLVLVTGIASLTTLRARKYPSISKRMSPFERTPSYAVYVPHHDNIEVRAESPLELVLCSAPGNGPLPSRLITPAEVGVEYRGKGRNQRLVHNILLDSEPANSLLVVKVYTDKGNTSLYPVTNMISKTRRMKPIWKRSIITVSSQSKVLYAASIYAQWMSTCRCIIAMLLRCHAAITRWRYWPVTIATIST